VPLTTLYFHQFPAYFIPANLVAIPLSFLAIYSGVSVLVTSAVPAISNFLGMLTNYLLFVLNYSVGFIENMPHSVLSITSVFTKEMILLYLVIIAVLMVVYYQKKLWIFTTLGLILLLSLSVSLTKISRLKQNKIIFYSTTRQTAIGFISGEHEDLIGDSLLLNDPKAGKFQLNGAETLFGVTTVEKIALDTLEKHTQHNHENAKSLYYQGHNLLFQTRRIAIIDSIPKLRENFSKLKVDYLVLSHNPKLLISDLLQLYEPGLIIIDGSNSVYKTDKWLEACKKAGLAAYSIKNQGAYVVDL
jgi:competence protein ComEC